MNVCIDCARNEIRYLIVGDQFFSWSPCFGCASPLGGDRFEVIEL